MLGVPEALLVLDPLSVVAVLDAPPPVAAPGAAPGAAPPLGAATPPPDLLLADPTTSAPCIPSWRWLSIGQYIK